MVCVLALVGSPAFAQSTELSCPAPGTRYTLSDGTQGEAVGQGPGYACRFKNLKTGKESDRLYGAFSLDSPIVKANVDKFQELASLRVGQKISFTHSGASVTGADGTWFFDVVI